MPDVQSDVDGRYVGTATSPTSTRPTSSRAPSCAPLLGAEPSRDATSGRIV